MKSNSKIIQVGCSSAVVGSTSSPEGEPSESVMLLVINCTAIYHTNGFSLMLKLNSSIISWSSMPSFKVRHSSLVRDLIWLPWLNPIDSVHYLQCFLLMLKTIGLVMYTLLTIKWRCMCIHFKTVYEVDFISLHLFLQVWIQHQPQLLSHLLVSVHVFFMTCTSIQ